MSIEKTEISVMDHSPLLVSRRQAKQLVSWVQEMDGSRPVLCRIVKQGRYAYFSNRFLIIRWDVDGLDVPDGSWIDLRADMGEANAKPDTLRNLANWARLVSPRASWDLLDGDRWHGPDEEHFPEDMDRLFTRVDECEHTVWPVVFNPNYLSGVATMVLPDTFSSLKLAPSSKDRANVSGWWLMGPDKRVAGMLVPMRMSR